MWKLNSTNWHYITGPQGGNTFPVWKEHGTFLFQIYYLRLLGITDAEVTPGGRSNGGHWIDSQGNLWLYGGITYKTFEIGTINSLSLFSL